MLLTLVIVDDSEELFVFNWLVKLSNLVAADELLVVTVLLRLVMLDCNVDPLVLSALVRVVILKAADELFVTTVF